MNSNKLEHDFSIEDITLLEKKDQFNKPVEAPRLQHDNFDEETTRLEPLADGKSWFQKFKNWMKKR